MKRWAGAWTMVLLCCLTIVLIHGRGGTALADRDTQFIYGAIRARTNVWSWFETDWPLHNWFYRPVTALSFFLDTRLFSSMPDGYSISAALYCAFCLLALFWTAREITNSAPVSALSVLLFALWQSPLSIFWDWISWVVAVVLFVVGFSRHRLQIKHYLPAVFAVPFLATELQGIHSREVANLFWGVVLWIPSRTATLMTLFGLCAIASYVRFVREYSPREMSSSTPLDLPATRTSSESNNEPSKNGRIWFLSSVVFVMLALGSYEQAVMLPAVLFAIGALMYFKGYRINWLLHLIFWCELFGYLALRSAILPAAPSDYFNQQVRTGITAYLSELNYIAPSTAYAAGWWNEFSLGIGAAVLLVGLIYSFPFQIAGNAAAYLTAFKKSRTILALWICSALAFLPMAFLKPFPHYHYWSMSLRSIFVVLLAGAIWQLVVNAVSPPTVQAPPRPSPAPGSLHHR